MHDEQPTDQVHEPPDTEAARPDRAVEDTDVISLIEDVERHLSRIRSAQSKQVQEFTDLATRMQALEQAEEALVEDAAKVASDRNALDQERAAVELLRAEVHQAREAMEDTEKELAERSEKIDGELESLREGREALTQGEEELAARSEELDRATEAMNDRTSEFEAEQARIQARCSEMETTLAENITQLDAAQEALAEHDASARDAQERCSAFEERCETLTSETEQMRDQLRKAGERLSELAEVVSEQAPLLEEGAAAMASMQEQARTIVELQRQVEAQSETTPDQEAMDERMEALQEECEQARKRADELEEALAIAQDRGQAQEFAKQLRDKAEHLSEFARHLDRRKTRLGVLRRSTREQAAVAGEQQPSAHRDLQRIQSQRKDLEATRTCLIESEKAMLSKWARPRALAAATWLAILMICVGGGSWLIVQNLLSSPGTATLDMVAATRSGRPLENTAIEGWMQWHQALPGDPAFVQVVASRLNARGIAPAGGEEAVAQLLANDLAFDSDGPGRLRLVLGGEDRRTVAGRLDVIATSMASESARQAPRREQSARAMIVGETRGNGRVTYASLVPGTIDGAFLTRYGIVSGVALAVALLFAGGAYMLLRRAKRIFEESEMELEG